MYFNIYESKFEIISTMKIENQWQEMFPFRSMDFSIN